MSLLVPDGQYVMGPGGSAILAYATQNLSELTSLYGFSSPPTLAELTSVLNTISRDSPIPGALSNFAAPGARGIIGLAVWIAAQSSS